MEPKLNFSWRQNMVQTHSHYGKKHNIIIEHYIISSGLKEMIEGTVIGSSW